MIPGHGYRPDLTTDDPKKQKQENSGGLTTDNSSAENHCTIYTINESPLDSLIIWAGTDDGNLQVTTDGGKSGPMWLKIFPDFRRQRGVRMSNPEGLIRTGSMSLSTDTGWVIKHPIFLQAATLVKHGKHWPTLRSKPIAMSSRKILVNPDLLFLGTEAGFIFRLTAEQAGHISPGISPKCPSWIW